MRLNIFTIFLVALLAGCASQKPSGKMEGVVEARATVKAIDVGTREVTLQTEQGQDVVIEVPQEAKNFDQIRVGDQVVASYTEAIAWQVKPASKGSPGVSADTSVSTAQPGAKPGATAGRTLSVTATITNIDLANGTVTLTGPAGGSQTIKARDPANLKKVQVGDLVDITYTEAVAVSVKPVK